eukprot:c17629_g1_i2.p1 GENE.c17629_g1_i2~~c17629_g1_i2.p1  ORF type:complete len:692 (+),score=169.81 c17629_g1_i2:40-2115(+)
MTTPRKVQVEIDRVLKRVNEGVQTFDEIWQKVYTAQNSNQKEKFESDLKKEIKKLQRYRDQIKGWISGNEIKDKSALVEARKVIETEMERFKVCEKETKTKAYSKEGLAQAPKTDPIEEKKEQTREWIQTALTTLREQIVEFEAEIESFDQGPSKKKKSEVEERKHQLEENIQRHKTHETKLEMLLRLIDNDVVDVDKVDNIRESVEYYVESNQESEFHDDDTIYDEFDIEGKDLDYVPVPVSLRPKSEDDMSSDPPLDSPTAPNLPSKPVGAAAAQSRSVVGTAPLGTTMATAAATTTNIVAATTTATTPTTAPAAPPTKTRSSSSTSIPSLPSAAASPKTLPSAPPPNTVPSMNVGNNNLNGVSGVGVGLVGVGVSSPATPAAVAVGNVPPQPLATAVKSATQTKKPDTPLPSYAAAASVGTKDTARTPQTSNTARPLSPVASASPSPSLAAQPIPSPLPQHSPMSTQPNSSNINLNSMGGGMAQLPGSTQQQSSRTPSPTPSPQLHSASSPQPGPHSNLSNNLNNNLSSNLSSNNNVPHPQMQSLSLGPSPTQTPPTAPGVPAMDPATAFALRMQHLNVSQRYHAELIPPSRPTQYVPANPTPVPSCFPQEPNKIFEDPQLFRKFDFDTLCFSFYCQQGTFQQYFAARELKRQSWRYHKKELKWFQRHEEPKECTDEYEQVDHSDKSG